MQSIFFVFVEKINERRKRKRKQKMCRYSYTWFIFKKI